MSISTTQNEKPYDRFLSLGADALTDAELLAIIIRTGSKGKDALQIANSILDKTNHKGLSALHKISLEELMSEKGVGEVKAVKIKCIAELSKRIASSQLKESTILHSPLEIANMFMESMRYLEKEHCYAAFFDGSMGYINRSLISIGTINSSLVSTREIFKEALNNNAAYFILLHNHPSGNPSPSNADLEVTKKIKLASEIMDIELIDHIIIGNCKYYSFKEHRLL